MRGELRLHGGRDQPAPENRATIWSSIREDTLPLLGLPREGVAPRPARHENREGSAAQAEVGAIQNRPLMPNKTVRPIGS